MSKFLKTAAVAVLLLGLAALYGCGGDAEANVCAGCDAELDASQAKMVGDAMYCAACAQKKANEEVIARHDCEGGCGMTDWPEDKMSQIDGKWYCKGCADKMQDDHGHDHDDHDGHDHG